MDDKYQEIRNRLAFGNKMQKAINYDADISFLLKEIENGDWIANPQPAWGAVPSVLPEESLSPLETKILNRLFAESEGCNRDDLIEADVEFPQKEIYIALDMMEDKGYVVFRVEMLDTCKYSITTLGKQALNSTIVQ